MGGRSERQVQEKYLAGLVEVPQDLWRARDAGCDWTYNSGQRTRRPNAQLIDPDAVRIADAINYDTPAPSASRTLAIRCAL